MPNTYVNVGPRVNLGEPLPAADWRNCEKLYVRAGGKWERVHGCYTWYALPGQNPRWHQIFEWGPINNPPPNNFRGVAPGAGDHYSGTMAWDQSTDPFVVGHQIGLAGPGGAFDYVVDIPNTGITSFTWGGMLPNNNYTFTIRSYDEFGELGPGSGSITYGTGHPREVRTNPSWPGADGVAVRPTGNWITGHPNGTGTYATWAWLTDDDSVRQGTNKNGTIQNCVGAVNYSTVYTQIIDQIGPYWGTTPPPGVIVVDDAFIQRIDRREVNETTGRVNVIFAPATFTFGSFNDAPNRFTDEITWQSPTPGGFSADVKFFRNNGSNALIDWAEHWIREQGSGHHGIACKNPAGGVGNEDGLHYVILKGGGATANQWTLEVHIRFAYEHIAHVHPVWA